MEKIKNIRANKSRAPKYRARGFRKWKLPYFIKRFLGSAILEKSRAIFASVFAIKLERLRLSISAILSICSTKGLGKLIEIWVIPESLEPVADLGVLPIMRTFVLFWS